MTKLALDFLGKMNKNECGFLMFCYLEIFFTKLAQNRLIVSTHTHKSYC